MILALTNLKGGVAKTTTAVNLAAGLTRRGRRVLLVDLDAQASASHGLGISKADVEAAPGGVADVLLGGRAAASCIRPTAWKGLDVLTGSMALADTDLQLAGATDRTRRLHAALATLRGRYDAILIDCPPGLGLVVVNGLAAADGCLIPIEPHYLALEGLVALQLALGRLAAAGVSVPGIFGIVLTRVDRRPAATADIIALVKQHYGRQVFRVEIPVNTRLAESPSHGLPIFDYDPSSTGARAYEALTTEVLHRLKRPVAAVTIAG